MISRLDPNGNGYHTGFVASAGSKYQCVDDGAAYSDADYVHGGGASSEQVTFTLTDLAGWAKAPSSITVTARMKRAGSSLPDGSIWWRSNSTDASSTKTIGSAYSNETDTRTTDPSGGGAWTVARVNALEVGCGAGNYVFGEEVTCSWIKADVTHQANSGFVTEIAALFGGVIPPLVWASLPALRRMIWREKRFWIEDGELEMAARAIRDFPARVFLFA